MPVARRRTCPPGQAALLACAVLALAPWLAGCGAASSAPGGTRVAAGTVDSAGGTIAEAGGAEVVVPPGAFDSPVAIAMTRDAAGAPPLPAAFPPAGTAYAITPHGGAFAEPVTVRLPAPDVVLAANQRLLLAKADPGGAWTLLDGTALVDGRLQAQVTSFSYFLPVVVSYALPVLQAEPFRVTGLALDCGELLLPGGERVAQDCGFLLQDPALTVTATTNGGPVPRDCGEATLSVRLLSGDGEASRTTMPLTGGAVQVPAPASGMARYDTLLLCKDPTSRLGFWIAQAPEQVARRPVALAGLDQGLAVWRLSPGGQRPAPGSNVVEVVAGQALTIAAYVGGGPTTTPNGANQVVVDWLRSDDQERSWRLVGTSFQEEGLPLGPALPRSGRWSAWRVAHRFEVGAGDQGAVFRARACWAPLVSTGGPVCDSGTEAARLRVTVLQSSALPAFTALPVSVLVRTGQAATFTAAATGTPAPALQWQARPPGSAGAWADVTSGTGGTTGSYATAPLALADNGLQLRVVARNAAGEAVSPPVTASVSDLDVAPTITTQPATLAVAAGGDAVFAVAARGTEALTYQWRLGGAPIGGATGPVLRLTAVTPAQAGRYDVVVRNAAGSATSDAATLDVTAGGPAPVAPVIVTQPAPVTVGAGQTATFAAGVAGTGPFSYQWRRGGDPIPGATLAYHSIAAVSAADAGSYSVVVTGAAGSATSAGAALTVVAGAAPVAPTITTQPAPQVQAPGGTATLAVAASGTGPLAFQWSRNGAPVAGATGPVLVLAAVTAADAGSYAVTVNNAVGTATSDAAVLTVLGAPAIAAQPAAATVFEGEAATFGVEATGAGLRYQWLQDGRPIAGATGASYTTPPATGADGGSVFSVAVANAAGLVVSDGAVLTVMAAPPAPGSRAISALWRHACAVTSGGGLACWGEGLAGQLGTGLAEPSTVPALAGVGEVLSVSAGADSTCVIEAGGALFCWGAMTDSLGAVGIDLPGGRAASVAVGRDHACAADVNGGAACWGWGPNDFGELGDGSTSPHGSPQAVLHPDGSPLSGAVAVAAGDDHTCAQLAGGEVFCWGRGVAATARPNPEQVMRQLGDGTLVPLLAFGQVQAGLHHACVVERGSRQPACWGSNEAGQLGDGTTTGRDHARLVALASSGAVVAGATHACGLRDADVFCWGTAHVGNGGGVEQLPGVGEANRVAALVGGEARVDAGAAGEGFTCVHWTSGDVQCWGENGAGQLGVGDTAVRVVPTSTAAGPVF